MSYSCTPSMWLYANLIFLIPNNVWNSLAVLSSLFAGHVAFVRFVELCNSEQLLCPYFPLTDDECIVYSTSQNITWKLWDHAYASLCHNTAPCGMSLWNDKDKWSTVPKCTLCRRSYNITVNSVLIKNREYWKPSSKSSWSIWKRSA